MGGIPKSSTSGRAYPPTFGCPIHLGLCDGWDTTTTNLPLVVPAKIRVLHPSRSFIARWVGYQSPQHRQHDHTNSAIHLRNSAAGSSARKIAADTATAVAPAASTAGAVARVMPAAAVSTRSGPASCRSLFTPSGPIGDFDVCLVVVVYTGPTAR